MEIDPEIPQQKYPNPPPQPVMSQQEAQKSFQQANTQPSNNYDSFFKPKIKSYRPHIIIAAVLQLAMYFMWPTIVGILLILFFEEDILYSAYSYVSQELVDFVNILSGISLLISIILIVLLIYFATMDAKRNTGQNPTGVAILVFFLGFIGAFIYILTTLKKQGKVAKKNSAKPN